MYVDLGTPDWSAVEINSEDWQFVSGPPVKFARPTGMRPLPKPERNGSIDDLKSFINVGSDDDFKLLVAWIVGSLSPEGPYPILIVNG